MKCIVQLILLTMPLLAVAQGMSPAEEAAFNAKLEAWAKAYFPAVVSDTRAQGELLLGFLVDERGQVLKHSVARQTPPPVAVADELKRMFPERNRVELKNNGAACIFRENTTEKKYCVVYATVSK